MPTHEEYMEQIKIDSQFFSGEASGDKAKVTTKEKELEKRVIVERDARAYGVYPKGHPLDGPGW